MTKKLILSILFSIFFILLLSLFFFNNYNLENFEENNKKYSFVHVPKTGGISVYGYLLNYLEYINFLGHDKNFYTATNDNNPIIVIREPIDRFISIYKYWKKNYLELNGSNVSDDETSVKSFIRYIQNNDAGKLMLTYFWNVHLFPQSYYINENVYKNSIIIKYNKLIMNEKLNNLLNYLNIPNKNINLIPENTSADYNVELDNEDVEQIQNIYKADFILWDKLNDQQELFKKVL